MSHSTSCGHILQVLSPSDREIIAFVIEHGKIATKECERLLGKHRITALAHIKSLGERGFLERVGERGPKVHYVLGKKLMVGRRRGKEVGTM